MPIARSDLSGEPILASRVLTSGLRQSELHAAYFRDSALLPAEAQMFDELGAASLAEQAAIERTDTGSFDDFVAAYNSSTLCGD